MGSVTPITNRGPAYIVPALITEFHAVVGNVPAVVPVRTWVSVRMPELLPGFAVVNLSRLP